MLLLIELGLRSTPWALPGGLVVCVLASCLISPVARLLTVPRPIAFGAVVVLGLIAVVTLTPSPSGGF